MTILRGNSAIPLDASADALSDVLDFIHLRGETLTSTRMGEDGGISHRSGERAIHVVQKGPLELEVSGEDTRHLDAGDLVLLATGRLIERFGTESQRFGHVALPELRIACCGR